MEMEQRPPENSESFVCRFELTSAKTRLITEVFLYEDRRTDSVFGGRPTVIFSTKFGVEPRPMIT